MTVEAQPPTRRNGRWTVTTAEGKSEKLQPTDGDQLRRAAKRLGVSAEEITAAVLAATPEPIDAPPPESTAEPMVKAWSPGIAPTVYESLASALDAHEASHWEFFGWRGATLTAVDLDVRDWAWSEEDIRRLSSEAAPTPRYRWRSRSGGIRAIFGPCARLGLSSMQRAGLWCLLMGKYTRHVGTSKVELVYVTRTPPGPWHSSDVEYGVADLRGNLLRRRGAEAASPEAVAQWLGQHGMEAGGRYDHGHCPYLPGPGRGNDPVVVAEDGIMCFRCGKFFPWSRIIQDDGVLMQDVLVEMASEWIHWEHARHVLAAERPTVDHRFLRAGYEALLRVLHAETLDEDRLRRVWTKDRAYFRSRGCWVRSDDFEIHTMSKPSAGLLPWTGGGPDRVDFAVSNARLSGYVEIEPVSHLVEIPTWDEDRVLIPQPIPSCEPAQELTLDDARNELRETLPGVTDQWLRYSYAFVVAALVAGLRRPQPPIIILTGTSGSGKGALAAFTSGVLGRPVGHLQFDGVQEFAMSIGEALEARACLLFGDEVGKSESWWTLSGAILRLGAVHAWRRLYHGHVTSPVRAALVLAGSTLPAGMLTMPEMVRRAAVARLTGLDATTTRGWSEAARRYLGVDSLEGLRSTPEGASIADAYIRHARETILGRSLPTWVQLGAELGLERMADLEEMCEITALVAALRAEWDRGAARIAEGPRRGWMRAWRAGAQDAAADLLEDYLDADAGRKERHAKLSTLTTAGVMVHDRGRRVALKFR